MDAKRTLLGFLMALAALAVLAGGWALWGVAGLLFAGALLCLVLLGVSALLARMTLRRSPGLLSNVGPDLAPRAEKDERTKAFIAQQEALLAPVGWEDVHITSGDGLKLHGYYIEGNPGETRTVVLVHGYSARALQMAEYALYWRGAFGVNVLMPDARAHGQSEGRYTGMGYFEKDDVRRWMDYLLLRHGQDAALALHGISMGGATVLSVGGSAPPAQLRLVVEDCGYTNAYDELRHQMRSRYHVPAFPLLPLAALWCRLWAGYWLQSACALALVKDLTVPTLFVHGEADTYVPVWMVHPLYENAACRDKTLVLVPGAAHVKSFSQDPTGRYRQEIARLVGQYMPPENG